MRYFCLIFIFWLLPISFTFPSWFENSKISLEKTYFKIFPNELESQLKKFNIILKVDQKQPQIKRFIALAGYKRVMDKLLKDSRGGNLVDCHQQAHYIGRLS